MWIFRRGPMWPEQCITNRGLPMYTRRVALIAVVIVGAWSAWTIRLGVAGEGRSGTAISGAGIRTATDASGQLSDQDQDYMSQQVAPRSADAGRQVHAAPPKIGGGGGMGGPSMGGPGGM